MSELKWFRLKEGMRLEKGKLYVWGESGEKPVVKYAGPCDGIEGNWYYGPIELPETADPDPEPLQCVGCRKTKVLYSGSGYTCYTMHDSGDFVVFVGREDRNTAIAAHNAAVRFINEHYQSG